MDHIIFSTQTLKKCLSFSNGLEKDKYPDQTFKITLSSSNFGGIIESEENENEVDRNFRRSDIVAGRYSREEDSSRTAFNLSWCIQRKKADISCQRLE